MREERVEPETEKLKKKRRELMLVAKTMLIKMHRTRLDKHGRRRSGSPSP